MAIKKSIWGSIKSDYEVGKYSEDVIFSRLAEEYPLDRSTISKKCKKEGWEYGKNSHFVEKEASLKKELYTAEVEKSRLCEKDKKAIEKQVKIKLMEEGILFQDTQIKYLLRKSTIDALNINLRALADGEVEFEDTGKIIQSAMIASKIVEPKAPMQINTTNAIQNNIKIEDMSEKEISNAYLDLIKK